MPQMTPMGMDKRMSRAWWFYTRLTRVIYQPLGTEKNFKFVNNWLERITKWGKQKREERVETILGLRK